jgi:hypothetical protein
MPAFLRRKKTDFRKAKTPASFLTGVLKNGRLEEAMCLAPSADARGYLSCELSIAVRGIAVPFFKLGGSKI